ncbi:MAG: condensation domain-containing protein, partial [Ruminococcus sp.]
IEHRGVTNLKENWIHDFKVTEDDKILLFANITFDASVGEFTMALLLGGTLCIPEQEQINDVAYIERCIQEKQLTIMAFPTHFAMLLNYSNANFYLTAGSEANHQAVEKIVEKSDFMNSYGPTETTVCATFWRLPKGEPVPEKIPIGKPHKNTKIYIMDGDVPCGIGVPGELCIVRDGIARGYLNRPELTAEKFVPNPFGEGRMYRSGDLARWLPDGNLEYMGRIDQQVKIRGFRIELGEIESVIRNLEGILDAAVIAQDDATGTKAIYAYVVAENQLDIAVLRNELSAQLPDYMVPAYMMQIPSIPMTRNGKLDKKALPQIEAMETADYIAPTNYKEKELCRILEDVLKVNRVGIGDNFFAMGGDSIKAIRIVSKAREVGIELSVKDVMRQKTVQDLAFVAKMSEMISYEQGIVTGAVESTPIIRSFAGFGLKKPWHFNQAQVIPLEDGKEVYLKRALTELVRHHDILRAVYQNQQLTIRDMEAENLYDLTIHSLLHTENIEQCIEDICNQMQASLCLEQGPLVKASVFCTEQGTFMVMCIHHLVVDGVSWRILLEDLGNIMQQLEHAEEVTLPAKTASFKEWGTALADYRKSEKLVAEIPYWETVASSMEEGGIAVQETNEIGTGYVYVSLNTEETTALTMDSLEAFHTEINDLLLAAVGIALKTVTGQSKVTIGLEGHGREEIHKRMDIDRTVGWFTCIYPVIVSCLEDVEDAIVETKEMLRKVPNHGLGFGVLEDAVGVIDADLYFNYLGSFDEGDGSLAEEPKIRISTGNAIAPENCMLGHINFNGSISDGKLVFEISYDKAFHAEEFICQLADAYEEALRAIIACCSGKEEGSVTLSDTYASDLGESDLDFINSLF